MKNLTKDIQFPGQDSSQAPLQQKLQMQWNKCFLISHYFTFLIHV